MLLKRGNFGGALAAFQRSLDLRHKRASADPDNERWQRDLFIIQDKIGDLQLSEGSLNEAMTSYQSSLDLRRRLVGKDVAPAQRQDDLSVGYIKLGDALLALGERDNALASYSKGAAIARAADGEKVFSLSRAANLLLRLGRPAEAIGYLNDLSQITPNDPSVYFDRGRAEIYSGNIPAANDDFAKASALKPDNPFPVAFHVPLLLKVLVAPNRDIAPVRSPLFETTTLPLVSAKIAASVAFTVPLFPTKISPTAEAEIPVLAFTVPPVTILMLPVPSLVARMPVLVELMTPFDRNDMLPLPPVVTRSIASVLKLPELTLPLPE
jgi:tetratricopeptide (TPR) repeat protein